MTSSFPSLSTILSEPEVARLVAEPGPWWLWTADASRLVAANTTGARAMGATGVGPALERAYSTSHAFAGQVARLAPTLPADGTPRHERLRIAGRFGSESVTAEAFRLRAGDVGLLAVRIPALRRGTPREAVLGFVADLRVPALAFEADGTPLASSDASHPLAGAALRDLVGPAHEPLTAQLAADGRAVVHLVNGPMAIIAVPGTGLLLALPAANVADEAPTGLRLVAGAPEAPAQEPAPSAEAPVVEETVVEEPAAPQPVVAETEATEPVAEEPVIEAPALQEAPAVAAEPATLAEPPAADTIVDEPAVVAETIASAEPAPTDAVVADVPSTDDNVATAAATEEPEEDASLAPPQRFAWKMDGETRFHGISPDEVAGPAGLTLDEAVARFGMDPDGALSRAVTARRPFSGVPALWPLGQGRRRLAVTLAAFPALRDGSFQGYAGFGLVVEEAAPAPRPETEVAEAIEAAEQTTSDEAAIAAPVVTETLADAPMPETPAIAETALEATPEAAVAETETADETLDAEAADQETPSAEVPTPTADLATAPDELVAEAEHDAVATEVTEEPSDTLDTATDTPAPDAPAPDATDAAEAEPRSAGDVRPMLTVVTTPPNVVALRSTVGQDPKRPGLSPGERNAFREIARALGVRTEDGATETGTPAPAPLPPPAEQAREPVAEPAADLPQADEAQASSTDTPPADAPEAPSSETPPAEIAGAPSVSPVEPETPVPAPREPAFVASGTPHGPLPSAFAAAGLDALPDAVALLDKVPAGLVVHRGNAVLFANRTLLDWIGFASAAELEEAGGVARLFAGGPDDHAGAVALTTRTGDAVPVDAHLSRVAWAGEAAFLFTLTRRAVEAAAEHESSTLTELRGRLDEVEQILDTATDGIVIVNADASIESMNRSAEALFGYEAAEVKGRPITALFAPESHRSALDYCDGLLSNGVASVLNDGRQVIGRVKQGGLIPLYMTMGRTGPAAKPKLAAVFRDMTHWKKAEEDLIAAKRQAEQASSQKSDFLAKISHEIRTPLNAIIGFSEVMMEERFGPMGNERYRDYLKDIHASGGHVLSLINDLLDLSKIEAGKLELAFTSVDLNDMIQSSVAIMQPQANRERVIIRSSLQPRLPNVVADSRSLRQIVLNLLSNAVKFTPAGGQIIVSTGLSDLGEAVLRVRDTGIGMTETELKAAMEPFRQVLTANPRGNKGTGLGLPLTKALVEANRASFAISSTPNQGTLVEVVFPPTRVLAE
ncbi:PAS domain-containing sensor histidine kinase [Phreatobacter oligotrophus]|uniref:histidine kinase n=1 Tax=Phreatobacter oligotrophus TaxID=1122261 RepID=A0A2T4YXE8_9HYPH|nr:PAS domain-containing sensor histidine kinase [Phreatobacter oligotrophus]PTM50847.1 PAS/PAC sensor signal transduction histidine kinase [Phreatobacter oligotrophus]